VPAGVAHPAGAANPGGLLLGHDEVGATILLPALFIVLGAERVLFAPAHRGHAIRADAERNQVILRGFGAA
jgi:hypothetical protein